MALIDQQGNREDAALDYYDLFTFKQPKAALMFTHALLSVISMGYWVTWGRNKDGTRGLITLYDDRNKAVGKVSYTDAATLLSAMEEFSSDVATLAARKTPEKV